MHKYGCVLFKTANNSCTSANIFMKSNLDEIIVRVGVLYCTGWPLDSTGHVGNLDSFGDILCILKVGSKSSNTCLVLYHLQDSNFLLKYLKTHSPGMLCC